MSFNKIANSLDTLPQEILVEVFSQISEPKDLSNIARVSHVFRALSLDHHLWERIAEKVNFPIKGISNENIHKEVKNHIQYITKNIKEDVKKLVKKLPEDIAHIVNKTQYLSLAELKRLRDWYKNEKLLSSLYDKKKFTPLLYLSDYHDTATMPDIFY